METIKCKAAISWSPGETPVVEDIEVKPPSQGQVRIKLSAASLCHTDITLLNGTKLGSLGVTFPVILGHEGAGVVESVGVGVNSVKLGDSVVIVNVPQCKNCKFCKDKKTNFCVDHDENVGQGFLTGTKATAFTCRGQQVYHLLGSSSWTEYTVCHESFVAKVNPKAPHDEICLLSCGVLTGFGGALNNAKVTPGSTCGVWGLGAVGLSAVLGCKVAGAKRIFAVDTNSEKFPIARKFGATDCLNPGEIDGAVDDAIFKMTEDNGLDFAIECIGSPETMRQAMSSTHRFYGQTTIIGCSGADLNVGPSIQFIMGRRINGGWMGGDKTRDAVERMVEDHLAGKLPLKDFITHRIGLSEIGKGVNYLEQGRSVKVVIELAEQK